MKLYSLFRSSGGPPLGYLASAGPPGGSPLARSSPAALVSRGAPLARGPRHRHHREVRCIRCSPALPCCPFSSSSSSSEGSSSSSSSSGESSSPGLLQLPGVHTPEQLLQLSQRCLRDSALLLKAEEGREEEEGSSQKAKRTVQLLDALSNALCKVADAAELIRNVHVSPEWRLAGAQVVQDVQQFMSVTNFSDPGLAFRVCCCCCRESGGEGLTQEESRVLMCMRDAMEQQGMHLSPEEKAEHLLLLEKEQETANACIAAQHEAPCLQVSVQQLLAAGVPQGLIANRTAELQQQEQQQQDEENFPLWGRKKASRITSLFLCANDDFTKASCCREGVLRTPEAVSTFLERIELALGRGLEKEITLLRKLAQCLPERFGVRLPLQPWDLAFLVEMYSAQHAGSRAPVKRLPLMTVWQKATEMLESLTGLTLVRTQPSPGETWHWSVLKFELRDAGAPRGAPRGDLYVDLWSRRDKSRLLAQFTGWELGGPLSRACVVEDADGLLRQVPCCALISNFMGPPSLRNAGGARGSAKDAFALLGECHLTEDESVHLLHEFGHAVHALASRTELQHLAGKPQSTRGAVDFSEFPSHLFEFFAPQIFQTHAGLGLSSPREPAPLGCMHLAHQLIMALLDRAFHSFKPAESVLNCKGELEAKAASVERQKLHVHLDSFFDSRPLLGQRIEGVSVHPTWKLLGRPPLRAFEHLVHYGGNYFCYLFCRQAPNPSSRSPVAAACRASASYVWGLSCEGRGAPQFAGPLLQLLEGGSTDCSAARLLRLLERSERAELLQQLSVHPERWDSQVDGSSSLVAVAAASAAAFSM
ncbi:hypothetical protein Esti_005950 [Eimeria stiedai]